MESSKGRFSSDSSLMFIGHVSDIWVSTLHGRATQVLYFFGVVTVIPWLIYGCRTHTVFLRDPDHLTLLPLVCQLEL